MKTVLYTNGFKFLNKIYVCDKSLENLKTTFKRVLFTYRSIANMTQMCNITNYMSPHTVFSPIHTSMLSNIVVAGM